MKPEQTRVLLSLRGAAASILWALIINGAPMGHDQLCTHTGYGKDSVSQGLDRLEATGLATRSQRYQGWMFTQKARQLALPGLTGPSESLNSGLPEIIDVSASQLPDGSPEIKDSHEPESAKKAEIHPASPEIKDSPESLDSEVKEESSLNLDLDSDSGSAEKPDSPGAPDLERILSATSQLFGESIYPIPGFQDPDLLIAWLANAYDRRDKLDHPARLVHNRLSKGIQPDRAYLENPLEYLPASFLQEAGLAAPEIPPEEDSSDRVDPGTGTDEPASLPPVDPSCDEVLPGCSTMTPRRAWQAAVGQLNMEMPKSAFDTWVRPVELIAYEDGVFVLGAPNAYARDWLESRLSSTITRLLTGICNRRMELRFTVY